MKKKTLSDKCVFYASQAESREWVMSYYIRVRVHTVFEGSGYCQWSEYSVAPPLRTSAFTHVLPAHLISDAATQRTPRLPH